MNRADFMKNLAGLLADMAPAEREEAIQYYNDYFDDAGAENEQSVIASLGTPEQLAATIKAGLFDGGNAGEFTEKGFSGYERRSGNEILDPGQAAENGGAGRQENGPVGGGRFNRGNGYGYRSENQEVYESPVKERENKGGKKKLSGGMIALIVVLCICAGPVLLGIGGGLFGVIVGLLGSLFGILVGFAVLAVVLLILGIGLFVFGIVLLFGTPLGGLCMIGAALICLAIGLFFLWLTIMICGVLIPAIVRGVVKLVRSIFHIGGATA
ncbi:MAG: hypothetical protein NC341_03705 [Blautia sp.]|nr:hypothetical protein [Blautia sp.]MCM1200703.1 hypothetical protein [Bacteroides fragilis]